MDRKSRPFSFVRINLDLTIVCLHKKSGNRSSQTRALLVPLGRIELFDNGTEAIRRD